jgi:hypothetical protein
MNGKIIKLNTIERDIRDKGKEKWVSRYQRIARMFHDEDYEQANREIRDFIGDLIIKG